MDTIYAIRKKIKGGPSGANKWSIALCRASLNKGITIGPFYRAYIVAISSHLYHTQNDTVSTVWANWFELSCECVRKICIYFALAY